MKFNMKKVEVKSEKKTVFKHGSTQNVLAVLPEIFTNHL